MSLHSRRGRAARGPIESRSERKTTLRAALRGTRGRTYREGALLPAAPRRAELPRGYARTLGEIKRRIQEERLRVVLAANSAMVRLYWDVGRVILERQRHEGWGARVIDRLSVDLREAYPDMHGLSPRNLRYMRAFAAAWPDRSIVQRVVAQLPWRQNIALLERVTDGRARLWYAAEALRHGWSQAVLCLQIERRVHARRGRALNNFEATLPPADSDLAAQAFKDPYLLLCRSKDKIVVEYALRDFRKPIGVAAWETKIVEKLPSGLRGSLPTVEEIEAELSGRFEARRRPTRRS